MTQSRLRDLVRASNPVVQPQRLLPKEQEVLALYAEVMDRAGNPQTSTDLLDQPVERRRDMQTQEKQTDYAREPRIKTPRRRRLVPALAAATAVLVIAAGVWAVTRTSEPEVADRSPLDVAELYNDAIVNADWAGLRGLYADSATIQFLFPDGPSPVDQLGSLIPEGSTARDGLPIIDWDGDNVVTQFDGMIREAAEVYAGGVTNVITCSQPDAGTVVCDEVREGFAFESREQDAIWTLTIADGVITDHFVDFSAGLTVGTDSVAVGDYNLWVRENRPELEDTLFAGLVTLAITPENVDVHRELVAEWQAQRSATQPDASDRTALEVAELFNQASVEGDIPGGLALFAESATYQIIGSEGISPEIPFSTPLPADAPDDIGDWDGDSVVTEADWWSRQGAEVYVGGTTTLLSCSAVDATTATCDEARDGFAFKNPGHLATWTITVVDGEIANIVIDLSATQADGTNRTEVASYQNWIRSNRPELEDTLFADFGILALRPDNLETHRELVAEWQAGTP